ncbi:hypothetical protein O181_018001 [Austropuccinia psidii MF-1]|uniref:Uncharacterized protein n=1 Tax=Austropuccinia psidii MF-1 TaxID=1389203 RepID=A0A9Q3GSI2_9BASI|nr:hypothetical protein [Austropuccinia psidii MF-1]
MKTTRREGSQNQGEYSHNPAYIGEMEPEIAYYYSFRLTRSRTIQLSSGFKPLRIQKSRGQESPLCTVPGSFQKKTRIKGKEQDYFQPEEEIIRPQDPEVFRLGESSTQKEKIIVNKSDIISTTTIGNDIWTQNEHTVVKPESNINSNELWLQMSQFAKKINKRLKCSNRTMQGCKKLQP